MCHSIRCEAAAAVKQKAGQEADRADGQTEKQRIARCAEEYGGKRTMAQLTADEKDAISHRGKAVQEIARRIGEIKE